MVYRPYDELSGSAVTFEVRSNYRLNREGLIESTVVTVRKDFCNDPSDAWPIILVEEIMLSPRCADGEWSAKIYLGKVDIFDNYAAAWDKNPLRAAMIAFLMKGDRDD